MQGSNATKRPCAAFADLPRAIHLDILLRLPFIERVRVGLVSRRWAALLTEPAVWADLSDFTGAREDLVNAELVTRLCRRAVGQLRSVDLSVGLPQHGWLAELEQLAAQGLTQRLQTISSHVRPALDIRDEASARRLLAACPSLSCVAIATQADWPEACAVLRLLPAGGGSCVSMFMPVDRHGPQFGFVAFCNAVAEAIMSSNVDVLTVCPENGAVAPPAGFLPTLLRRATEPAAVVVEAAARLGAALVNPAHGPREIDTGPGYNWRRSGLCTTPIHGHLWRALSRESRLQKFVGSQGGDDAAAVDGSEQLADALASGRAACLHTLSLTECAFSEAGCA